MEDRFRNYLDDFNTREGPASTNVGSSGTGGESAWRTLFRPPDELEGSTAATGGRPEGSQSFFGRFFGGGLGGSYSPMQETFFQRLVNRFKISRRNRYLIAIGMMIFATILLFVGFWFMILFPRKFATFSIFSSLFYLLSILMFKGFSTLIREMSNPTRRYFVIFYCITLATAVYATFTSNSTLLLMGLAFLHISSLFLYLWAFLPGGANSIFSVLRHSRNLLPL